MWIKLIESAGLVGVGVAVITQLAPWLEAQQYVGSAQWAVGIGGLMILLAALGMVWALISGTRREGADHSGGSAATASDRSTAIATNQQSGHAQTAQTITNIHNYPAVESPADQSNSGPAHEATGGKDSIKVVAESGGHAVTASPLDVDIQVLNSDFIRVGPSTDRVQGGWLYVLDVQIVSHETANVALEPHLTVTMRNEEFEVRGRNRLRASDTPATEIDEQLSVSKSGEELGRISHLQPPIALSPTAPVGRGYVSFLLPETAIPRGGGGFMDPAKPAAEFSQYPPDSESLLLHDLLSKRDKVVELDVFALQSAEWRLRVRG